MRAISAAVVLLALVLAKGGIIDEGLQADLCWMNITDPDLWLVLESQNVTVTIQAINLCDNKLETIDNRVFQKYQSLEQLGFDNNKQLNFDSKEPFLYQEVLTALSCVGCGIRKIYNRSLQELPKLERINLAKNQITDIEENAFMKSNALLTLDLWYNDLGVLSNGIISGASKITELILSYNQKLTVIEDQPFLISDSLETLHCEGCGFTVIYKTTFVKLRNLRKLYLTDNSITEMADTAFNQQSFLMVLHLQNNRLESVYAELLNNRNLKKLCLRNNTDQLLCDLMSFDNWKQFQCSNDAIVDQEVDCSMYTLPPEEPTTTVPTSTVIPQQRAELPISNPTTITTTAKPTFNTTTILFGDVSTSISTLVPEVVVAGGISDWFITSYFIITIIIITALIATLVLLVGVWFKVKKYDSDPKFDSVAESIFIPCPIYETIY